jgi:uncharacterized membrane protein
MMRFLKKERLVILVSILFLSTVLAPAFIYQTHAASGEVCLADPSAAGSLNPCPATPPVLSGPVGQLIRVGVFISGSGGLNAFDITLRADSTKLKPQSVDLTGTVLLSNGPVSPSLVLLCAGGTLIAGTVCSVNDTVDTLHVAAASAPGAPNTISPTTGLLFTAIYNVTTTTATGGISVSFPTSCSSVTSVVGGTCVTIADGTKTDVPETVQGATFDNSASANMATVTLSANRTSFGPEFPNAANGATIVATAKNGYPGTATDQVTFSATSTPPGLTVVIPVTTCATHGTSCSVNITLTGTKAGTYSATVSGTYATHDSLGNPDTLSSVVTLEVIVDDFSVTVNPTTVTFNSGTTATATITLASLNGFSGTITLSTAAISPTTGLTITYSPNQVLLSPGATVNATMTFQSNAAAATYHARVSAATSGRTKVAPASPQVLTIIVTSGADFSISANPAVVSVKPGVQGLSTITTTPVGGFNATIALSFNQPSGLSCSLGSTSVPPLGGSTPLTCSGSVGTYSVVVMGTGGLITHSVSVTFIVSTGTAGLVCLAQSGATDCPFAPPVLTGGTPPTTQQLSVAVVISNSNGLNAFDITLLTNSSFLKPAGYTLTGAVVSWSTVLAHCIGGAGGLSAGCTTTDNQNTLHIAAASQVLSFAPTTGLLFTAIYNVTGTTSNTLIGFQTGCTNTSVASSTVCVTLADGSRTPVPETVQTASFSNIPSFSVAADPATLSLQLGSSANSSITVTSVEGFSGIVSLATLVTPIGPSASLSLSSLKILPSGMNQTLLTITASSTLPPGVYSVKVTGTSGTLTDFVILKVVVIGRDFSINANPSTVSLNAGSIFNATITVSSLSGFSGTIHLSTAVARAGLGVVLSLTTITLTSGGTGTSGLVLIPNTAASGTYIVSVTGTNGTESHTVTVTVNVEDFQIFISPDSMTIQPNIAGLTVIQVNSRNGFTGTITLSTSAPVGLTATTIPSILSLPSNSNVFSTLKILASTSIAAGNYTVTVSASSNGIVRSAVEHVFVIVPTPTFSLQALPNVIVVAKGFSNSSIIKVSANSQFSGTVSLAATSSPFGLTLTLSSTNITLAPNQTANATLTIGAGAAATGGFYQVDVTGVSGQVSQFVIISVQVETPPAPDFSMIVTPAFASIVGGNNFNYTITLTSLGLSGSVSLTASSSPTVGNAPSLTLVPTVLSLSSGGTATAVLRATTTTTTPGLFYTLTVNAAVALPSGSLLHSSSVSLQVIAPPDETPTARFTISPSNPTVGETVTFDGSTSSDPDGSVQQWTWDFGDGFISFGSVVFHSYSNPGTYTVRLSIRDIDGQFGNANMTIVVLPKPPHDVSINNINVFPTRAVATEQVFINIQIENNGLNNETVSVTAYANNHPIQTLNGIFVQGCPINTFFGFCYPFSYVTIIWDTTGVVPGNYTISATVLLPAGEVDPTPADNSVVDGVVTVLPAPIVTLTPSTGPDGTKVTVQGSGFPIPSNPYGPSVDFIDVTFDDMFVAFTTTRTGSFNLTIDVPLAQPGSHLIKAFDEFSLARASATFTVTPTGTGNLAVSIDSGTIYFPGDTAVIYVLTSFNGAPVGPSGLQLQLVLFKPDGTNSTLQATFIGGGLYKASYAISSTGPLGTYAVRATAHESGPLDATALRSFEVKPTWLSQNGKTLVSGATIAGVVGLVAFAWRQGYLPRRKSDPAVPSF